MAGGATVLDVNAKKRTAAVEACKLVKPGMILGLGTGSTMQFALEELAALHKKGLKFQGISTSRKTDEESRRLRLPLTSLDEHPRVDLTIDGADEIDVRLNLIKGGGGALVREKVVAASSRLVAIIADDSKFVMDLGVNFPVPVEILPFGRALVLRGLEGLGAVPKQRMQGTQPYTTDNGGWILDAKFPKIRDPVKFEQEITMVPGVIDCGIFTGLADVAFLGTDAGVRRVGGTG